MNKNTISPPIGGYFRHNKRTYKAVLSNGLCHGCDFYKQKNGLHSMTECAAPTNVDCSDKIYKDATDDVYYVLVEKDRNQNMPAAVGALLACSAVFAYFMYKIFIN